VEIARKIFFRTGARKMHNKNLLRICFLFSLFVLGSVLFFLTFFLVICFRFFFNKVVFSIPVFCSDLLSSGLPCRQFCYTFFLFDFFLVRFCFASDVEPCSASHIHVHYFKIMNATQNNSQSIAQSDVFHHINISKERSDDP